jgi:hypothetical protein
MSYMSSGRRYLRRPPVFQKLYIFLSRANVKEQYDTPEVAWGTAWGQRGGSVSRMSEMRMRRIRELYKNDGGEFNESRCVYKSCTPK